MDLFDYLSEHSKEVRGDRYHKSLIKAVSGNLEEAGINNGHISFFEIPWRLDGLSGFEESWRAQRSGETDLVVFSDNLLCLVEGKVIRYREGIDKEEVFLKSKEKAFRQLNGGHLFYRESFGVDFRLFFAYSEIGSSGSFFLEAVQPKYLNLPGRGS